jgi:hypothetical protein
LWPSVIPVLLHSHRAPKAQREPANVVRSPISFTATAGDQRPMITRE